MRIVSFRVYEGANIYNYRPVILLKLDLGRFDGIYSKDIKGFNKKLINLIPTLNDHFCSRGKKGGFIERLREGTLLGHVIEHVILEIQHLAGFDVIYGKTTSTNQEGIYDVIFEYGTREGGIQAAKCSVALVKALAEGESFNFHAEFEKVKAVSRESMLGPSTEAIVKAAKRRGIPVTRIGFGSLIQLGYGKHQKRVMATITGETSCIGVDIACDKNLSKEILTEAGLPVPWGFVVRTEEEAIIAAEKINYPVVVKPLKGNQGKGVSLNLLTKEEVLKAFNIAQNYDPEVLIEKYITGKQYRLLVVGDRVEAVSERLPAQVEGDGLSTVAELIEKINRDPLRGEGHEKPLTKIRIDETLILNLSKKGLTTDYVPGAGEKVILRENANLSTGGTAIDVTEEVHPDIKEMAVRAAKVIGLDIAGIDIVAQNINRPLDGLTGAIIEVNAAPGIRMHQYPCQGQPRDVGEAIVNKLFPPGVDCRIPIISITGTNGKTTTTRMISRILEVSGFKVGMTTTDGIFINNNLIFKGDATGPLSAKAVLKDPTVDVAVLETARGGILRAGLGYDEGDVGIITNISSDHLGQDGIETLEDLADVKALVGETVSRKGSVILNADDPFVARLSDRMKSKIIYFSQNSHNIIVRRHLGAGGMAVFVRKGMIIAANGNKVTRIVGIKQIPATFGGLAAHNVQNSLAAVAGCLALGINPEKIREGLTSFACNLEQNPGRLNIFEFSGIRVMVDYGHNAAGYESIITTAQKLKPKRLIGVIGVPGDRQDDSIRDVGRIAGKGFDYIIIKEDANLRGRKPGDVAGLLKEGVIAAGFRETDIKTVLVEEAAVALALEMALPGDLVIIFYENLEGVIKVIKSMSSSIEKDCKKEEKIRTELMESTG